MPKYNDFNQFFNLFTYHLYALKEIIMDGNPIFECLDLIFFNIQIGI